MQTELREIYKSYFSPQQLRLAWERMIRSNGRDVKDYFGIKLFGVSLQENLERLSDLIINGEFSPQRPFKYYEPKASGTQRTKSVLSIEDALIYQAIVNKIASENYKTLTSNNSFVFGSVLHPEVEKGMVLTEDAEAEFYFFKYYVPLYKKFINSANEAIENEAIQYKLETDITGFFDSIPHSALLMKLHSMGVEEEILDLLADCLNMYSGTKSSATPGVGLPQGQAPSFFLANVMLHDLDYEISQQGYTYYRYMDDIYIYEESLSAIRRVLILIDNHLKGKALSLNTKKTSIKKIGEDRKAEKKTSIFGVEQYLFLEDEVVYYGETVASEQKLNGRHKKDFTISSLTDKELKSYCKKEIKKAEKYLLKKFKNIHDKDFSIEKFMDDKELKKEIIHYAYLWRSSNSILKTFDQQKLSPELKDIWLFCVEHFYWKADHFCWNLNQYGPDKKITDELINITDRLQDFEWVQYQILNNLAMHQDFSMKQLKKFFRQAKKESSSFTRLALYQLLIRQLNPSEQLLSAVKQALKDDEEAYIRKNITGMIAAKADEKNIEEIEYWFSL
jgi:hypothetical protein